VSATPVTRALDAAGVAYQFHAPSSAFSLFRGPQLAFGAMDGLNDDPVDGPDE